MLAKLLITTFTSFWKLRVKYQHKSSISSKLAKKLYHWYLYENNSSIDWETKIKNEPCFPHGIKGIFISGAAKIGENCIIFQQVTIGSITLPDSKNAGAPTIGDNVYIGAGAKIIGNISVGDNVRIGANAVIYQDVPSNSIVVASSQVIENEQRKLTNKYYSFNNDKNHWVYFEDGQWLPELNFEIQDILSKSQSKTIK